MVGHSLGAFEALRFTDLHRKSVIGMVLLDPDIPDRAAAEERFAPQWATRWRADSEQTVKQLQDCAAELRRGTLKPGSAEFDQCTAARGVPSVFPHLKAAMARLNADPERLLTQASTQKEHQTDSREVINAQRRYGDMPLIVLTAGGDEASVLPSLSGASGAGPAPAELEQLRKQMALFLQDAWGPAHDAYAALSTRGRNQLVPDSGHDIQIDKPAVVISAVMEVLDEIRPSAPNSP
jgi:pimeloyl-ACP methyl ester carboxylesterase